MQPSTLKASHLYQIESPEIQNQRGGFSLFDIFSTYRVEILFVLFIQSLPFKNAFYLAELKFLKLSIPNTMMFILLGWLFLKTMKNGTAFYSRKIHSSVVKCVLLICCSFLVMVGSSILNDFFSVSIIIKFIGLFTSLLLPILIISNIDMFIISLISILFLTVWAETVTILMGLGYLPTLYRTADMIGSSLFKYRSPGVLQAFGDHAILISLMSLFCIYLFFNKTKILNFIHQKLLVCLLLTFLCYACIALQSRNVFITNSMAILSFFIIFLWDWSRNDIKNRALTISISILVFISILLAAVLLKDTILHYMLSIRSQSEFGRIGIYNQAIKSIIDSPLYGIGIGKFYNIYGQYEHNSILSVLLAGGIIGFTGICVAITLTINSMLKLLCSSRSRNSDKFLILLIGCSFISALFAGQFYLQFESWIFWLQFGITLSLINLMEKS